MSYKRIPEIFNIVCDECGTEECSKTGMPTYWACVTIERHEDWAGGKSVKHYCDKCYGKMIISFGE